MLIACAFFTIARAEMSPVTYRRMQDSAAEALEIRVTRVVVEKHADGRLVSAWATVTDVRRTATKRKAGDKILVRYVTAAENAPPVVGPAPVPVLKSGETTVGYLDADGKVYRPAARGQSFVDQPSLDGPPTTRPSATPSPGA